MKGADNVCSQPAVYIDWKAQLSNMQQEQTIFAGATTTVLGHMKFKYFTQTAPEP